MTKHVAFWCITFDFDTLLVDIQNNTLKNGEDIFDDISLLYIFFIKTTF